MTKTGEAPQVNDIGRLSGRGVAVWVKAELDSSDGLMAKICPRAFEVGLTGSTHTRFGQFLGSTASNGWAGLRPVLSTELSSVVEAVQEDVAGSGRIATRDINPEKLWPQFIGKSTLGMIKTIQQTLEPRPLGGDDQQAFNDLLAAHLSRVATVLGPEPVEIPDYAYVPSGDIMTPLPTGGVIARIDVFELFGLDGDGGYSAADREEITRTLQHLASNLTDDYPVAERQVEGILSPLAAIANCLTTLTDESH